MKLTLFALLGLIVAASTQDEVNFGFPKDWHMAPSAKPGACPPQGKGWTIGPRPLTKKGDQKPEGNMSPSAKPEKPENYGMNNFYPFPFPNPYPFYRPGGWYPQFRFPPFSPPQIPHVDPILPPYYSPLRPACTPQCHTDTDCKGAMKCCGTKCNARCQPPLQYDANCGLGPTDAYCKEVCDKKEKCITTPIPDCRNYKEYCVSFCRNSDKCFGGNCCRNLRCSFTCTRKGYGYGPVYRPVYGPVYARESAYGQGQGPVYGQEAGHGEEPGHDQGGYRYP